MALSRGLMHITHTIHLDEPLVPRKLNKKKIKMKNSEMRIKKKSEIKIVFSRIKLERSRDFFFFLGIK